MPRKWQVPRASASRFTRRPRSCSRRDPSCWVLHPGESWHGFEGLPDGWCMLDPIKFGIVCPGMKTDGQLEKTGIPADIVTAYLGRHGIVPSRTTDHMVLFLFSIGVTKGKWGTLLNTLLDFKIDYDRNAPLAEVLPALAAAAPQRYAGKGFKDLGDEMWAHLRKSRQGHWQAQAYATLPEPKMTPRRAFQRLMAGDAEKVPLDEMADRVVAVGVIPYPPGIPIVMPGESVGTRRRAVAHLPAHAAGVRASLPRIRERGRGRRGARRRLPRLLRRREEPRRADDGRKR